MIPYSRPQYPFLIPFSRSKCPKPYPDQQKRGMGLEFTSKGGSGSQSLATLKLAALQAIRSKKCPNYLKRLWAYMKYIKYYIGWLL